jgi:CRP-like cAMP-binding protein
VAVEALRRLGEDRDPARLRLIRRAWQKDDRAVVREAALLAFCQASGADRVDEIAVLLDLEDIATKQAAIVGLARYCGDSGRFIARSSLQLYLESPEPEMRRTAARIVGLIGQPGYADMLEELLFDGDDEARLQAAEAAALTGDVELIPLLLGLMNDAELRSPAIRALGSMPQTGVARFAERIGNDGVSTNERRLLLRTLARIGGPDAVGLLWEQVSRPEQKLILRVEAARSLRSLRISEGLYHLDLRGFWRLQAGLQASVQLLNQAREEVGGTDSFTAQVYRDHAFLNIELMLSLYGLKHAPHQIDRTLFNLFADDPTTRSRALELLDVVLPRRLAPRIVSLIQPAIDELGRSGAGLSERTAERLLHSDSWLRTVTARYLSRAGSEKPLAVSVELSPAEQELYDKLDTIIFLKSAPLFKDLPADYLSEQTEMAQWLDLERGQALFEQGDRGDALYVVAEGEMVVLVDGIEVNRLGPGECIGEMALLDDSPRSAAVTAGTDARLLLVTAVGFQQLLETEPAVARAIMRTLDQRIRKTQSGKKISMPPADTQQRASRESMVSLLNLPNLHQIISKITFLQQVELFKDLPPESLTRLATIVQEVSFFQGEELFQQGDVGDCLYLISAGVIDIVVDGNPVAQLGKNASLGEMALIGGMTRSATARVAEDARLLRLWSEDFYQLLATEPEVATALVRTLAARLRQVSRAS